MYTPSSVITDTKLMDKKIGKGSVNSSSFYVYTEKGKDSKEYIIVNSADLEGSFECASVKSNKQNCSLIFTNEYMKEALL